VTTLVRPYFKVEADQLEVDNTANKRSASKTKRLTHEEAEWEAIFDEEPYPSEAELGPLEERPVDIETTYSLDHLFESVDSEGPCRQDNE